MPILLVNWQAEMQQVYGVPNLLLKQVYGDQKFCFNSRIMLRFRELRIEDSSQSYSKVFELYKCVFFMGQSSSGLYKNWFSITISTYRVFEHLFHTFIMDMYGLYMIFWSLNLYFHTDLHFKFIFLHGESNLYYELWTLKLYCMT
ncbi:hypothetical protein ACJX0J_040755 [Zea mays]